MRYARDQHLVASKKPALSCARHNPRSRFRDWLRPGYRRPFHRARPGFLSLWL